MMQLNGTYSNQAISGTAQSDCTDTSGALSLTLNTTATSKITDSNVKVTIQHQQAVVTGVETGESVAVYSTHGIALYNQKATTETVTIPLPAKGVYVVHVGSKSFKVVSH